VNATEHEPVWHAEPVEAVVTRLGTDTRSGLRAEEAARRLEACGPNTLEVTEKRRWYTVLARQFFDVLIAILMLAAVISLAVGEVVDAVTILLILLFNGALGFVQEWRAERALEALRQMLSLHCTVIRDGVRSSLDAAMLVPGDVVLLELGNRVPADLRLSEVRDLKLDESVLTGESESVVKDAASVPADRPLAKRASMAWTGTAVTSGRARGLVVATGMQTEFGRIARLTQSVEPESTPLRRKLAALGGQLGVLGLVISSLIALSGWLLGKPLLEMFMTGISLAVAIVPEGLPAVVTITLALGIRSMVRRRALIRRMQAAETLGAATVICTDKTGTLTQNEMTVRRVWLPAGALQVTGGGYEPAGHFEVDGQEVDPGTRPDLMALVEAALVCNHARLEEEEGAWSTIGEPTEGALLVLARKAGLDSDGQVDFAVEFPFNSSRKRMTVVAQDPEGPIAYIKGAPEFILDRCRRILDGEGERTFRRADRRAAVSAYQGFAERGLRTLALARRRLPASLPLLEAEIERDLTLLGVVGIIDPPRPEVPDAIAMAQSAGIRVVMITGDASATALAIARRVGLDPKVTLTGQEVDRMDDTALREALGGEVLFARTTPEHKLRIVTQFQNMGHVAAMTGDGVNDAPALKKADIGIAMGRRSTDVAKGASDMVLTDDNFASIVGAVEEGRRQYDNIQKFVRYLLSSNTGEVVAIFFNILTGGPLILLPVQILWMNLVTDGLTAVALGVEPVERGIMQRPPRDPKAPLLNRAGLFTVLALGGYIGFATLWLFQYYLASASPEKLAAAQTVAFTGIILLEKMNVLNFRALRAPLSQLGFFSNPWLLVAIAGTIGLQVAAVYVPFMQKALHTVPLGWADWGVMLAVAVPIFVVTELVKRLRWREV
jgi:Ca2+-transporting ATPase